MNAMTQAMEKAGFKDFAEQTTHERKVKWLFENGLRSVLPIKQVKLHLGVVVMPSGVVTLDERYVTKRGE